MFPSQFDFASDFADNDVSGKIEEFIHALDARIEQHRRQNNLPLRFVKAAQMCSLVAILDQKVFRIFVSSSSGGASPLVRYVDRRINGHIPDKFVIEQLERDLNFQEIDIFSVDATILHKNTNEIHFDIDAIASEYVQKCAKLALRPVLPAGFERLGSEMEKFFGDHPDFDKNVFVAMRFRDTPQMAEVMSAIRNQCQEYGLNAIRADDRVYPKDGDLWDNICVYMLGCRRGIFVFEEIDDRSFNPNVPLEYGFMRALNKELLLLKDHRMPQLPSDVTGKIYKQFDTYNITNSIKNVISAWFECDLRIKRKIV